LVVIVAGKGLTLPPSAENAFTGYMQTDAIEAAGPPFGGYMGRADDEGARSRGV